MNFILNLFIMLLTTKGEKPAEVKEWKLPECYTKHYDDVEDLLNDIWNEDDDENNEITEKNHQEDEGFGRREEIIIGGDFSEY